MIELEKLLLCNFSALAVSGIDQNHWVKDCSGTRYSHSFNVLPIDYLLITNGKMYLYSEAIWQTPL